MNSIIPTETKDLLTEQRQQLMLEIKWISNITDKDPDQESYVDKFYRKLFECRLDAQGEEYLASRLAIFLSYPDETRLMELHRLVILRHENWVAKSGVGAQQAGQRMCTLRQMISSLKLTDLASCIEVFEQELEILSKEIKKRNEEVVRLDRIVNVLWDVKNLAHEEKEKERELEACIDSHIRPSLQKIQLKLSEA